MKILCWLGLHIKGEWITTKSIKVSDRTYYYNYRTCCGCGKKLWDTEEGRKLCEGN